jgi:hypothetical protein
MTCGALDLFSVALKLASAALKAEYCRKCG